MPGASSKREGGGMRARLKTFLLDRAVAAWDTEFPPRLNRWLILWYILRPILRGA